MIPHNHCLPWCHLPALQFGLLHLLSLYSCESWQEAQVSQAIPNYWTLIPIQLRTSSFLILSSPLPTETFPWAFWNPQSVIRKISFSSTSGLGVSFTSLMWLKPGSPQGHGFSQSLQIDGCSSLTTFESLGQKVGYMLLLFTPACRSFSFPPSKNKTASCFGSHIMRLSTHSSLCWPVNSSCFTVTLSIILGDFIATEVSLPTSWTLIPSNSSPPVMLISTPTSATHSQSCPAPCQYQ